MGSGGVAIAALPTVICLKVPFSDGLGVGCSRGAPPASTSPASVTYFFLLQKYSKKRRKRNFCAC